MTEVAREVLKRALELTPQDRARLAHEIMESLADEQDDDDIEGELSPEWREEIGRRLADEPSPESPWATGEQVVERLRREVDEIRDRKRRGP